MVTIYFLIAFLLFLGLYITMTWIERYDYVDREQAILLGFLACMFFPLTLTIAVTAWASYHGAFNFLTREREWWWRK